MHINISDRHLTDTVSRLVSLCNIPAEDITFCDERAAEEHIHSAGCVLVLYQSSGYIRTSLHRRMMSALDNRYRAMPTPLDYSEFCKAAMSLARETQSDNQPVKANEPPSLIEDGCTLTLGKKSVRLTEREMALFACLRENSGKAVSRDMLRERVWENGAGEGTNVVDVYVSYLRRKLTPLLGEGAIISVRGQGYMLNLK